MDYKFKFTVKLPLQGATLSSIVTLSDIEDYDPYYIQAMYDDWVCDQIDGGWEEITE